ncbi:hypothetical protein EAI_06713 [Harpegnathos saltator]|uniref:Uncharacterized protein n=1 Tax=Harpegnathos saltator TaxID=610380 RepID=E2BL38_HARSA|nr:hypothetical protein EAI_06713 [Harpegnathos saltator]
MYKQSCPIWSNIDLTEIPSTGLAVDLIKRSTVLEKPTRSEEREKDSSRDSASGTFVDGELHSTTTTTTTTTFPSG